MKKKTTNPSTFDNAFADLGYTNIGGNAETTNMDQQDTFVDVEPNTTTEPDPVKQEPEVTNTTDVDTNTDNTDIPEDVLNRMKETQTPPVTEEPIVTDPNEITDADLTEAQQVGAFFDAVAEKFGWNIDDINEDDRPVTVEDFTQYIHEVVEENSKPQYADERIQALDEYVKNGGKFENFYAAQQQVLNYDTIDLEDETNQRTVIRELLKSNGYSDEQIMNKINRYENADMLEEEAEDALNRLKVIKQQETAELQKQQEALRIQQEEQNKAFFEDVNKQISGLTSIRGIQVPKEDRKALFDYIFKQDASGQSQYQKDFNKNLTKNLIESAYFTMRGDSFVTEAKKTGETTAAQKLRQMLRHTSKNHSTFNADDDKQRSALEIASRLF